MGAHRTSLFDRYPKLTLFCATLLMVALIYGLISIKWIKNDYTEHHKRSVKSLVHQYHATQVIDNNVGRFVLLREHRPNTVKWDRPSRNYLKNVAENSLKRQYYRLETDENGFILPSGVYAEPDRKIVFIGGSTTECYYVAEQNRFPAVVGKQLSEKRHEKINTYNSGVSANDTLHGLNILLNKVLPMKPDVVVLMENINDLVVLRSQGTYWYGDSVKSHIQTGKNVFTRAELPPHPELTMSDHAMLNAFKKNLQTFVAICRIHDIQPILMTQANRVDDDPLYHRFNEVIRSFQNEGVKVIDLAKLIPASTENMYDHYHYTDKGSLLAAEHVTEALNNALS